LKYQLLVLTAGFLFSELSMASCSYVPVEYRQITVQSCEVIEPRKHPKFEYYFSNSSDNAQMRRLETSYTGALITALSGIYFLRDNNVAVCESLNRGDNLYGSVRTSCCDGDPNSPCILGTSKTLYDSVIVE